MLSHDNTLAGCCTSFVNLGDPWRRLVDISEALSPADAVRSRGAAQQWIPAFAGMTALAIVWVIGCGN
jgi:hypothetical protein